MREVHVVGAAIVRGGELFAARRGPDSSQAGLWELPGGKVEPGEDEPTALIRELQEELGITVDVGPRLGEATHDYPGIRVRLVAYGCRILHGAITPVEHDETVWLSPERVWALNWAPADVPLLEPVCAWMQHEAPGPW